MEHNGFGACGIADGETFVLTGGRIHNHVTRWVQFLHRGYILSDDVWVGFWLGYLTMNDLKIIYNPNLSPLSGFQVQH